MSRRRKGDHINGVVLLDKPAGYSSNQALQTVRRLFNARKGGHTGNLDPFATGMLPICLGEASKTAAYMLDAGKAYRAIAQLGVATATGDPEGEVVDKSPVPATTAAELTQAMEAMTGTISQVPPMYSALKHEGKPLYELARQGITVERKSREVTIHSLELLNWDASSATVEFDVSCSKGTYIRTLAEDLAGSIGTLAHLRSLRRLWVAPFEQTQMVSLEQLQRAAEEGSLQDHLLPVDAGLKGWPQAQLDDNATRIFMHGNKVDYGGDLAADTDVLVRDALNRPLGIGSIKDTSIQPRRVFLLDVPGDS